MKNVNRCGVKGGFLNCGIGNSIREGGGLTFPNYPLSSLPVSGTQYLLNSKGRIGCCTYVCLIACHCHSDFQDPFGENLKAMSQECRAEKPLFLGVPNLVFRPDLKLPISSSKP